MNFGGIMNKKYKLKDKNYEISETLNKELEKIDRRYKYIKYLDKKNNLTFFDRVESLVNEPVDETENVEEIAIKNIMLDKLKESLKSLSKEELFLIENLIYLEKSERELSRLTGIPRKTIGYQKNKILEKLKKILNIF